MREKVFSRRRGGRWEDKVQPPLSLAFGVMRNVDLLHGDTAGRVRLRECYGVGVYFRRYFRSMELWPRN